MKRAVITGMGIVSPLGNSLSETLAALQATRSGIQYQPLYEEMGLRSHIAGSIEIDQEALIDRKLRRFMGDAAAFSYIALKEALADSGLEPDDISNERTGIVAGSGGASSSNLIESADILREKGLKRVGPYRVTRTMSSTVSACLATAFSIKGINYSITSACSTSLHCIGNGVEQIQYGKQDIVFAGGGEEVDWTLSCLFDAMGAMSSKYNDTPELASRAFDATRDGFVIAGGGGMVVLEELEHAKARGAKIYGEVTGYGATSDGHDMVAPSGEGGERSMKLAISTLGDRKVDYINAHGTSTPAGDVTEVQAVRRVFGDDHPPISSTKSMTGHSLGATGVQEAIYSMLMMQGGYITPSINVTELDPALRPEEIVTEPREATLDTVLSNSFGFGGTNATLCVSKYHG